MEQNSQNNDQSKFSLAHHTQTGPILGALLIVLVLILGGLYLWGSLLSEEVAQDRNERVIPNNEPETPRAEADRQILETVSSSNDLDAIEADLISTNLESVDAEFTQIENELAR